MCKKKKRKDRNLSVSVLLISYSLLTLPLLKGVILLSPVLSFSHEEHTDHYLNFKLRCQKTLVVDIHELEMKPP